MKQQWYSYVIVGLLSIGAGVAIAGLPDSEPATATISVSTTVFAPARSVPDTTEPLSTLPSTTVPGATTPVGPDTTAPISTESDVSAPEPVDVPDRGDVNVAAANGANVAGVASRAAFQLVELGYVAVPALDGSDIVESTTVYFVDGFDEAARRLAADLDLVNLVVEPIESLPVVADLPAGIELVVYVGTDRT